MFLFAHTVETEDEYYVRNSSHIITNVVASLRQNSTRVFQYVEMVYFRRWWLEQNATTQSAVRELVAERRLVFLTGGLCMNDEATTHHGAIIGQMTWGHRFLNSTFGPAALPTVGWQIDAFGHSAGYTALTAASTCPHPLARLCPHCTLAPIHGIHPDITSSRSASLRCSLLALRDRA